MHEEHKMIYTAPWSLDWNLTNLGPRGLTLHTLISILEGLLEALQRGIGSRTIRVENVV
jgi:hypothetical protein